MKPKNLKEFKALIKRYETITLEEITKEFRRHKYWTVANELTGFGATQKHCTLCEAAERNCSNCVYGKESSCMDGKNGKTYYRITNANTPLKLRNAYRARAKHMKTLIK